MDKQTVSKEVFEKKVESEAAHLIYMNGMSKEKADKIALEVISERFEKA